MRIRKFVRGGLKDSILLRRGSKYASNVVSGRLSSRVFPPEMGLVFICNLVLCKSCNSERHRNRESTEIKLNSGGIKTRQKHNLWAHIVYSLPFLLFPWIPWIGGFPSFTFWLGLCRPTPPGPARPIEGGSSSLPTQTTAELRRPSSASTVLYTSASI